MLTLSEIKQNIENWNQVRHQPEAIGYLTRGFHFKILRSEFETWQNIQANLGDTPEDPTNRFTINMYIGVNETEEKFYLVDSYTDRNQTYQIGKNLVEKRFSNQSQTTALSKIPNLQMTDDDAFLRSFKWQTYAQNWFQAKQNEWQITQSEETGVMRAMIIPFEDLTSLFAYGNDHIYCFFGLDDFTDPVSQTLYPNEIELLLSTVDFSQENNAVGQLKFSANLTTPCPPFSIRRLKLNLFKQAI